MKRLSGLVLAGLLCAAGASGSEGFGLFGSYMQGDDLEGGKGGGVKFTGEMAPDFFIEARASYLTDFEMKGTALDFGDFKLIPIEANLKMAYPLVPDAVEIYAGVGAGYYIMPEFKVADVKVDLDDTFGFFAIAGGELQLNYQISLFAEFKYTWLKVDGAKVAGEKVNFDKDIDLTGWGVNAGLVFHW